jgi:hypothetical protein
VLTITVVAETPYFFAILLILLIPVILYPFFDSYTLVHTADILANLAGVLHNKLITMGARVYKDLFIIKGGRVIIRFALLVVGLIISFLLLLCVYHTKLIKIPILNIF